MTIGPNRQWKWVKGETKQKKYRPRGQAKTLLSKRFGYLDTYTYNERKLLICPSGYTFGQGMHALHRLWIAYKISKSEANIGKMEHYAGAIQEVQEDMGLKTTSFPQLGIYGDQLTLYDHSTSRKDRPAKVLFQTDHSELNQLQEPEDQKQEIVKKLNEIASLIQPDIEKGEELVIITDEIPRPPKYRIKHENRMHFSKKRDQEWICEECGETVHANKNHICKHKEQGNVLTMSDESPFRESS